VVVRLQPDSLDEVERKPFLRPVVELGRARAFVPDHRLGVLECASIAKIGHEGTIATISVGAIIPLRVGRPAGPLPVYQPHDFRPPVNDRQHRVRFLRGKHRNYTRDAHVAEALQFIDVLA